MYRWSGEEDDQVQLSPLQRRSEFKAPPLHHWTRCDLSKIVAKFAHIIDVDGDTLEWKELVMARITIGCESVDLIPRELTIGVDSQLRRITIKIIDRITLKLGTIT